ncbi:MAG: phosphofructokinase, partial [Actinobacteria bacterium]
MRIGILTGGGDVPGLNPGIKSVVNRVAEAGHEVVGIRRGWGGLLNTNPDDPTTIGPNLVPLSPTSVRTIDRTGGTVLHTSRTNPSRVKAAEVPAFLASTVSGDGPHDLTKHVLSVIESQRLDVLIPIGGDDT